MKCQYALEPTQLPDGPCKESDWKGAESELSEIAFNLASSNSALMKQ